jgi:hypothetical protein
MGAWRGAYRVLVGSIDGRIILKWMFNKWDGCLDWIDLAHDSDR